MRHAIVLALLVAGCAHQQAAAPAPGKGATTASAVDPLQERGAALFDAAVHDDRAQLKTLVDWPRYRVVVAALKSRDETAAGKALAEIDSEPQPTEQYIEAQVVQVANELSTIASGPLPPQISLVQDHDPHSGLPSHALSPSRARLVTLATEALQGAREVVYDNSMGLVFVKGQLVYAHAAKVIAR
jgi:hypothetical protein